MKKIVMLCAALLLALAAPAWADSHLVTQEWLTKKMGSPDIVILDVRRSGDWNTSADKIKGAQRMDPGQVSAWAGKLDKDKTYVLYCA